MRTRLAETYAPATTNKMLSALRGVLREAWRLGLMSAEDYHRAADLQAVRGETLPRGRALGAGELAALLRACSVDAGPAGARDAALLALLYGGGLRRSEAVALDVADYEPETGALTIRAAKGRKDRTGLRDEWGGGCPRRLAGHPRIPSRVLCSSRSTRAGGLHRRRMSGQAVMAIVAKRAREAGVAHASPHDLRRTFVSDLLDAGADITTVSKLAGHADVSTTSRYDRRGEATKRKAAELLHVPYVPQRRPVTGDAP